MNTDQPTPREEIKTAALCHACGGCDPRDLHLFGPTAYECKCYPASQPEPAKDEWRVEYVETRYGVKPCVAAKNQMRAICFDEAIAKQIVEDHNVRSLLSPTAWEEARALLEERNSLRAELEQAKAAWETAEIERADFQIKRNNLQIELEQAKANAKPHCEYCGSDRIYSGPPDCPTCGAPNCCQTCCKITTLELKLEYARAKIEGLEKWCEGRHKAHCILLNTTGLSDLLRDSKSFPECDCGLSALLEGKESK